MLFRSDPGASIRPSRLRLPRLFSRSSNRPTTPGLMNVPARRSLVTGFRQSSQGDRAAMTVLWFRLPIGDISGIGRIEAALAQPVEHRFRKAGVRCSSHLSGTTRRDHRKFHTFALNARLAEMSQGISREMSSHTGSARFGLQQAAYRVDIESNAGFEQLGVHQVAAIDN